MRGLGSKIHGRAIRQGISRLRRSLLRVLVPAFWAPNVPRAESEIQVVGWRRKSMPLLLALLGLISWVYPRTDRYVQPPRQAAFSPPPPFNRHSAPRFHSRFVDDGKPVGIAHSPSISELPNGGLGVVWYAGSREGGRDVAICFSEADGGEMEWSPARPIMNVEVAVHQLQRKIRKVGNPVLFGDGAGRVHLAYVSVALGGWSTGSLNITSSHDSGTTWEKSRRLTLSPFVNISELVRCPPVYTESGDVILPIYHEFLGKFPQLLWLRTSDQQLAWSKTRMDWGRRFLQPVVVPISPRDALAYYRHGRNRAPLMVTETRDGGLSWSASETVDLPNNDASIAALRLVDGRVLLAFSDDVKGRSNMTLAVSSDGRQDWQRLVTLDHDPNARFAYPYMVRAQDGMIHLVYSWKMKRIRHVAFNEPWLDQIEERMTRVREQ
jgi:predicted neuraminidase